ncbi:MAG: phenylacetate-CoA oxygenase subunit PaaI [Candidatus Accumulibacter meliphilus]|jgi:ring-1,2-phenylacetyl-CoA epoxidase subunit PaaC|uniref:Phenylacetate-CoA oxygenase subunit PaaI n=1 Tax=Candidatus Accumulibacter meliphilus TaxID=2211374 RepID=A0A369XYJ7_9PROT|nr:MAG: phenylacetate-CoA oxygenase subunit PaaI [Candidatus Accumulibacter meliphilus]
MKANAAYLLHLADNAVVLGQRNSEWCGHGPILEEDIALANMSLDMIGQARLLYQLAATRIGGDASEDRLAYFRDASEYRNYTLLELPHNGPLVGYAVADRDYATTTVRNFLYGALMVLLWDGLQKSADEDLAAIAAKSLKEASYHLHHSRDWLIRFGDGTEESHARAQAAVDHLFAYSEEFWSDSVAESAAVDAGVGVDLRELRSAWDALVDETLTEAKLARPEVKGYLPSGKNGAHSEHLSYLLGEMQVLARAHPGGTW